MCVGGCVGVYVRARVSQWLCCEMYTCVNAVAMLACSCVQMNETEKANLDTNHCGKVHNVSK